MKLPLKLLFLCTGNSCRSIIAEALADHLGAGRLHATSAGSRPAGKVHPGALAVLSRHEIPVSAPKSKSMDELEGREFDIVITVCDAAAGEACPVWLADTPKVHWGIPDPAAAADQTEQVFEATFQRLRRRIEAMLALDLELLDPAGLVGEFRRIHRGLA